LSDAVAKEHGMKQWLNTGRVGWGVTLGVSAAVASLAFGNAALYAAHVPQPEARTARAHAETQRTEAQRQHAAEPGRASLLASPFGPMPARHAAASSAEARPRNGLMTTREHAEDIDAMLNGEVVWISLDCCAAEAVERALGTTHGLVAARDLPPDAPVFVDGEHADPAQAVRLADRLADGGLTRVFVLVR
jgi:hypothetical protein